MSELALAAFAAERGVHPRLEERSARFAAFRKAFDGARYLAALERRGLKRKEQGYEVKLADSGR